MKDRRKLFYKELTDGLKKIDFQNKDLKLKVAKGKLELWFNDGMYVLIDISTFVTHHKKGEFGVDFGINIYSGTILKLLSVSNLLAEISIFRRGEILCCHTP